MSTLSLLDDYSKQIAEETKIDRVNLEDAAMRLPARKHFWLNKLTQHKRNLYEYEQTYNELLSKLVSKILKESDIKLSYQDAEKIAYCDDNIKKLRITIKEIKQIVEYLEKVEKIFSSMSYDLTNIISLVKMEIM